MKTITLIASKLSQLTGHNRFDTSEKILNDILKRNKLSDVYIPKSNVEETLIGLDKKALNTIKEGLKLDSKTSLKDVEKAIKNKVKDSLDGDITESSSIKKVKDVLDKIPALNKIKKSINQDIQIKRGNIKESKNLDTTQVKEKIIITSRNSDMFNRILYVDPEGVYQINIRGKIDGLTDNTIVETKNRSNRFFNKLPKYEQVQLEGYMFLTGFSKAIHIECFNGEQQKIDYEHDEEFWTACKDKIIKYVDTNVKPLL